MVSTCQNGNVAHDNFAIAMCICQIKWICEVILTEFASELALTQKLLFLTPKNTNLCESIELVVEFEIRHTMLRSIDVVGCERVLPECNNF